MKVNLQSHRKAVAVNRSRYLINAATGPVNKHGVQWANFLLLNGFSSQCIHQGVMYNIHDKAKTCQKKSVKAGFQPLKIPDEAQLLGQAVLGSSSGPGQGLLVNTWTGDIPKEGGQALKNGCVEMYNTISLTNIIIHDPPYRKVHGYRH